MNPSRRGRLRGAPVVLTVGGALGTTVEFLFDAPPLPTTYLDKPMHIHRLVQAITGSLQIETVAECREE